MTESIMKRLTERLEASGCGDKPPDTAGKDGSNVDGEPSSSQRESPGQQRRGDGTSSSGQHGSAAASQPKKTHKKRKKKRLPSLRIYCGTFVHATKHDPMVILKKWMVGVDGGKIIFTDSMERYREVLTKYHIEEVCKDITICMADGQFMMPGLVDAHTSAVGLLAVGVQDKPPTATLTNGMGDRRTHKQSFAHDDRIAKELFNTVVQRAISHGTTTMAFTGSHVESATRLLTDTLARGKQRAFVGLDVSFPENNPDLHLFQMAKARDVIDHIKRKESHRVKGHVIISSPLPPWLQTTVAEIQKESQLPVKACVGQLPLSEASGQSRDWMKPHRSEIQYYEANGLLHPASIFVYCRHCNNRDLKRLVDKQAAIVYCPAADFRACSFTDLDRLARTGLPVGLGSDLPNGDSLSMLAVIRQSLQAVKVQRRMAAHLPVQPGDGATDGDSEEDFDDEVLTKTREKPTYPWESGVWKEITYRELFRMATLGGASVLGLEDVVGSFEIGKSFDAFLVDPLVPGTVIFTVPRRDQVEDLVEKFIFLGDDRNIARVYIEGERVK